MRQSCTLIVAGVLVAACLLQCFARQEEAAAPAPAALASYAFPGHNLRPLKGLAPFPTCVLLYTASHALVQCNSNAHGGLYHHGGLYKCLTCALSCAGINYAPTPSDFTSYGQGGAALQLSAALMAAEVSMSVATLALMPYSDTAWPEKGLYLYCY